MTFEEIAEAVHCAPGVHSAIIQNTHTYDWVKIAREPGSDAWQERREKRHIFRVFVRAEKGGHREEQADATGGKKALQAVIATVFEALGLPLPEELQ